jgi:hypothetical protein
MVREKTDPEVCNQVGCVNRGSYRFSWPGRDEEVICEAHLFELKVDAFAKGVCVRVIPLDSSSEPEK